MRSETTAVDWNSDYFKESQAGCYNYKGGK